MQNLTIRGVRSIKLSGGEPTVRRDLPEIIYTIHESGLHTVITTNGIRIRPIVFDAAAACRAEFKFSIHRPNKDNDDILGVESFDSIVTNMAICAERGVRFAINSVITAESICLMDSMIRFALAHGAHKISFIPVIPRGRAARREGILANNQLRCIRERASQLARHHSDDIVIRCIDIRRRDYWVIENDGTMWIEREAEGLDIRICDLADLLSPNHHA